MGKIRGYTKNNRRKLSRATKYSLQEYIRESFADQIDSAMGPSSASRPLGSCQEAKVGSIPTRAHSQSVGEGLRERTQDVEQSLRQWSPVSTTCFIPFSFLVGFFLEAFACRPWWTTCAEPYGKMQSVRALFPFSSSSARCCA